MGSYTLTVTKRRGYRGVCLTEAEAPKTGSWTESSNTFQSRMTPVVKGDHTTDYPYWAGWREEHHFGGDLNVDAQLVALSSSNNANCGYGVGGLYYRGSVPLTYHWPSLPNLDLPNPSSDLVEFLQGAATTSALADARRSAMNIPLLIAERQETVKLVKDKLRVLSSLATTRGRADLRRYFATRKQDRRKVARDIAGEHLAFLFGVLPLVGEVEGLVSLLNKGEDIRITGRGRRADVDDSDSVERRGTSAWLYCDFKKTLKSRSSVRCSLKYDVVTPKGRLPADLGFNPLSTVYDIVPLSFLSDFISNTGNFIRSLDEPFGLRYATGSWTLFREATLEIRALGCYIPWNGITNQYRVTSSAADMAFVKRGHMNRQVYDTEPGPSWFLMDNMTWGKAVTLAALAVQRYVKPLKRIIRQKQFRYKGTRPKYLPPIPYK